MQDAISEASTDYLVQTYEAGLNRMYSAVYSGVRSLTPDSPLYSGLRTLTPSSLYSSLYSGVRTLTPQLETEVVPRRRRRFLVSGFWLARPRRRQS